MTAMSRAVLLALQHPAIVAQTSTEQTAIDNQIRGSDVLNKLVDYCRTDTNITTARLLERFRSSSNHEYLSSLAVRPYWPDNRELDEDTAAQEFLHCLKQLQARSLKTDASKVDASHRKGLLSIPKKS